MPTYDYKCPSCDYTEERFHSMSEKLEVICPNCEEANLEKQIGGGAGVIFKGSGFYQTDYKRPAEYEAEDRLIADTKKKVRGLRKEGKMREAHEGDIVTLSDAKKGNI